MEFNWYQGAERCMARLSADFLRIKKEHLDRGDYGGALESWQFSLSDSNHMAFEPHITQYFFKGITFNGSAIMLRDALERTDEKQIRFSSEILLGCIAQEKVRRKAEGPS